MIYKGKIKLTSNQIWIVAKALDQLTSDEGMKKLHSEFPNMDELCLMKDLEEIIKQLEKAK